MTAPNSLERILGALAALMFLAIIAAVARGHAQWAQIGGLIWLHLATVSLALALTPILFWRRRGDALHRQLGWVWAVSMLATAGLSLGLRLINNGAYSFIHILSLLVIVAVPLAVLAARRHKVQRHRRGMRAVVIGGLLAAGFFTFPFDRLLGRWLFG